MRSLPVAILVVLSGLAPAQAGQIFGANACMTQVFDDSRRTIDCTVIYQLSPTERGWLKTLTVGTYRDATCKLRLSLDRLTVYEHLTAGGTVRFPPQDVTCDAETRSNPSRIDLQVSPTVRFERQKVVEADPNVRITQGFGGRIMRAIVSRIVNASSRVETLILTAMNDALE